VADYKGIHKKKGVYKPGYPLRETVRSDKTAIYDGGLQRRHIEPLISARVYAALQAEQPPTDNAG
jgi:hypothetical protein